MIQQKMMQTTHVRFNRMALDALKKCMGRLSMSNRELGERTFNYYKEMECSDED